MMIIMLIMILMLILAAKPTLYDDDDSGDDDEDGKLWHVGGTMVKPALDINLAGRALDTEERGLVT